MSLMTAEKMQAILEAALMVSGQSLTIAAMQAIFPDNERPAAADIKNALAAITTKHEANSGVELKETASGYRFQAKAEFSPWLAKLWEDRAPRYSRAFLETLAIIAYKQPITRAEIEEIRGVTVSSHIIKTLLEREWIRVIGYREVPGKPAILGTTKDFLDHFNLKSLTELPTLAEFKNFEAQEEQLQVQLALENSRIGPADSEVIPEERDAIIFDEEDNIVTLQQPADHTDDADEDEELATG
jgi:segregation and condensation protein B